MCLHRGLKLTRVESIRAGLYKTNAHKEGIIQVS